MNLITIRLRRWQVVTALISILGLAGAHAAADQRTPKSVQPDNVHLVAQREAAQRPDSPAAKETDKQPERPWWEIEPSPRDEQPAEEGMTLPSDFPPKLDRADFRDLEKQLQSRAEAILRELVELPPGSEEAARRLEDELKNVRAEIDRLRRDFGRLDRQPREPEPGPFEVLGERLELAQRAIDLQCMIYELPVEAEEEIADLRDELKVINARLEEIVDRHPELQKDREFLKMHIESLRRAVGRMKQRGKPEAADRFMRDQLAIIRRLDNPGAELPDAGRDDLDRRIKHVDVAIDNLRAAGLDDFAERLVQELERMVNEDRRRGPDSPDFPGWVKSPKPWELPYRNLDHEPGATELQRQVDRMQREMDELRGLVEQLVEENRRGNREQDDRVR